jgi:DNA invertase Pin-like site-specific DNA recombinase
VVKVPVEISQEHDKNCDLWCLVARSHSLPVYPDRPMRSRATAGRPQSRCHGRNLCQQTLNVRPFVLRSGMDSAADAVPRGYRSASTCDQNPDSQRDALKAAGRDEIFIDQGASGKLASRPELARPRPDDTLVITRLSRAMRSLRHLLELAAELSERKVHLQVLKQGTGTSAPQGRLVFRVLGAIDEFRRVLIVEGTREGLGSARARDRTGGRPWAMSADQVRLARQLASQPPTAVVSTPSPRASPRPIVQTSPRHGTPQPRLYLVRLT